MTRARDENRVRLRRERLGMQLNELARHVKVSAGLISSVEGGFVPKHFRRSQIAVALSTSPEELWPEEYA